MNFLMSFTLSCLRVHITFSALPYFQNNSSFLDKIFMKYFLFLHLKFIDNISNYHIFFKRWRNKPRHFIDHSHNSINERMKKWYLKYQYGIFNLEKPTSIIIVFHLSRLRDLFKREIFFLLRFIITLEALSLNQITSEDLKHNQPENKDKDQTSELNKKLVNTHRAQIERGFPQELIQEFIQ